MGASGVAHEGQEPFRRALQDLSSIDLDPVPMPPEDDDRLTLAHVESAHTGTRVVVTVELALGGRRTSGTAEEASTAQAAHRTAASATLLALQDLTIPRTVEMHLDWVDVLWPPSRLRPSVVHVAVAFRTAEGEQLLMGSAVVGDDPAAAAARATLDAVNRRLTPMLPAAGESPGAGTRD